MALHLAIRCMFLSQTKKQFRQNNADKALALGKNGGQVVIFRDVALLASWVRCILGHIQKICHSFDLVNYYM